MLKLKHGLLSIFCICVVPHSYALEHALLVGVGNYENPSANLVGIDLDLAMAQQIAQHLGVKKAQIKILQDDKATVEAMRKHLQWLAKNTKPSDRIMIYFSGHGSQVADENGDEADGFDETLYLHNGHLIDDEFATLLNQIPSQNIVVMIDACHSGTGTKSLAANRYALNTGQVKAWGLKAGTPVTSVQRLKTAQAIEAKSQNYLALSAAQDHEYAIATETGSIFTKALLDSFSAVRKNTLQTTWQHIFNQVKVNVAEVNQTFTPNLTGSQTLAQKTIHFVDVIQYPQQRILWQETMQVVENATSKLNIDAPSSIRLGELIQFKVQIPQAGYLNIITVGPTDNATVLFPNPYVTQNYVTAQNIEIPTAGSFNIRAQAPLGKNLVAAFLTDTPTDLQKSALANRDHKGILNNLGSQTAAGIRSLVMKSTETKKKDYLAGFVEVEIKK